jgi:uncharacterized protein (TIGR03437 family)
VRKLFQICFALLAAALAFCAPSAAQTFSVDTSSSQFCFGNSSSNPPVSCSFNAGAGSSGQTNETDTLAVSNLTNGNLPIQVTSNSDLGWLRANLNPDPVPANGASTLTITVNARNLPPNNYNGTVTLSAAGTTVVIAVTLSTNGISVALSPDPAILTVLVGQSTQATIHLISPNTNSQLSDVGANIQSNQLWLTISNFDGSNFVLTADASSLRVGPASATVTVQYNGNGSPFVTAVLTVLVTVTAPPMLTVKPGTLTFTAYQGRTTPSQTIAVSSSDGSLEAFNVTGMPPWITVSPTSATASANPFPLTVSLNPNSLQSSNSGTITITMVQGGGTSTVNVTATLLPFSITASPNTLTPIALSTGKSQVIPISIGTADGAAAQVSVTTATDNGGNWLTTPQSTISAPGQVNVTAAAGSLSVGTYTGHINFSCVGVNCTPVSISVTMTVSALATLIATPPSLTFQAGPGGSLPPLQTVAVAASDQSQQTFSFSYAPQGSWLKVTANQMTTPSTLTVSILSLPAQNGSGAITLTPVNGSSAVTIPVSLSISSNQPVIPSGSVVFASNFGGFHTIAPGAYAEIYGSNLSTTMRGWAASDFTGPNQTVAPTSLDGVSVQIGGKSAFVNYISPTQVNVVVPDGISLGGTVEVVLTNKNGTSAPTQVTTAAVEPGLLAPPSFAVSGKQYVVAMLPDGTYVLPTGAVPGLNSRPAKPNEVITVYGLGFGAVTPATPIGTISEKLDSLQNLHVSFGQVPATLNYDGLGPGYVGLYQFNIVVPAVPDNNAVPLTFNLGGVDAAQTLYTAVHQ